MNDVGEVLVIHEHVVIAIDCGYLWQVQNYIHQLLSQLREIRKKVAVILNSMNPPPAVVAGHQGLAGTVSWKLDQVGIQLASVATYHLTSRTAEPNGACSTSVVNFWVPSLD